MTTTTVNRLDTARVTLKVGLGLAAFLAGLDKFAGLLADWPGYLAPSVAALLPLSPAAFMRVVGVVEMGVGAALLGPWTRPAAWVTAAWLLGIAGNLVLTGHYFDVAVRDVIMALAAFTLARLSEAQAELAAEARHGDGRGRSSLSAAA